MGNTPVNSLDKWWIENKQKESRIVRGPYIGWWLKSPENKTVLVFGENHHSDLNCSNNEQLFINLFSNLITNNIKEQIDVILELCGESPIYFSKNTLPHNVTKKELQNTPYGLSHKPIYQIIDKIPDPTSRLTKMLKIWKHKCDIEKGCNVKIKFSNYSGLNTNVLREINNENATSRSLLQVKKYTEDYLNNFVKGINPIFESYSYKILSKDILHSIDKNFRLPLISDINNCVKNISSINKNTIVREAKKSLHCAYDIGRYVIDYYSIINTLGGSDQIFVYQGFTHSIHLVAYLLLHHKYRLIDVAIPENVPENSTGDKLNCMKFNNFNIPLREALKKIAEIKYSDQQINLHNIKNIDIIMKICEENNY